jgi:hypothetical protein
MNSLLIVADLLFEERWQNSGTDTELFELPKRVEISRKRPCGRYERIFER